MWHVSSRSGVATLRTATVYTCYLLTYFPQTELVVIFSRRLSVSLIRYVHYLHNLKSKHLRTQPRKRLSIHQTFCNNTRLQRTRKCGSGCNWPSAPKSDRWPTIWVSINTTLIIHVVAGCVVYTAKYTRRPTTFSRNSTTRLPGGSQIC